MTPNQKPTGIILFAHGSSVEDANRGVLDLAQQVQEMGPYWYVRAAFLELARPDLRAAVAEAFEAGVRRLIIIPYFLTMGVHLRRDLPSLVAPERQKFPGLKIEVGQPLEGHPLIPSIVLGRVREVLEETETAL